MENTRTKILDLLRRGREATIEDLTSALGLAAATVRRHLDILQRDGYVQVRPVRRETGRPHYAFSMTEAGEELFPHHYVRITTRLTEEMLALAPDDTSGKSGAELADVIFARMAGRLARNYAPRVTGGTLAERLAQTSRLLAGEGILLETQERGGDLILAGRACPCRRLAAAVDGACGHDRTLLSLLLRAQVEPLATPVPGLGDVTCAYLVRERPA